MHFSPNRGIRDEAILGVALNRYHQRIIASASVTSVTEAKMAFGIKMLQDPRRHTYTSGTVHIYMYKFSLCIAFNNEFVTSASFFPHFFYDRDTNGSYFRPWKNRANVNTVWLCVPRSVRREMGKV